MNSSTTLTLDTAQQLVRGDVVALQRAALTGVVLFHRLESTTVGDGA